MKCDELRDLIPIHVVDLLDPEESMAVKAHLAEGCPRCAAEVAAFRETLSLLPLAIPPEEPSPMVKARLTARIRKDKEREQESRRAPSPPREAPRPVPAQAGPRRVLAWSLAASAAAAIISSVLTASFVGGRHAAETAALQQRLEEQSGRLERQSEEMASLRTQIRDARESIQLVSSPGVAVIDLEGQGSLRKASARVFWDRSRSYWQLYAANLPPAGPGKTYQLWFITSTAKISAGVFDSEASGEVSLRVQVPPGTGTIVATAVTDEPAGGSPQPTGTILLLGKV